MSKTLQLLEHLKREIGNARQNSDDGQFPILDLLGNLRDEAASNENEALRSCCAEAWERMIQIVESSQPFTLETIEWLKVTLQQIQTLAGAVTSADSLPDPMPPRCESQQGQPSPNAEVEQDLPLILNIDDDGDLLREFVNESREHLDNIEQGVLVLEAQPKDAETLNTIFRAFHTFKGSAGFLNLIPVNRLAHLLESLLDLARQNKLSINQNIIDLILRGRDVLKQFLDEIDGQVNGRRAIGEIRIPTADLRDQVQQAIDASASEGELATSSTAIQSSEEFPEKSRSLALALSPEEIPGPVAAQSAKTNASQAAKGDQSTMVKVETGKLDSLLDLVGEMVIAQSLVGQELNRLADLNPQFTRNVAQLGRITKELQRVSMSMRMMPIRGLFQKMTRVVRDIGAKQNKKVQLIPDGEDTELDRGVVEELNDPLLHMIRNSMDHGIESSENRVAKGKPAEGAIHLRAFHQGGNIVIEVGDDGAGLDRDRILAKAIERGLTSPDARHTDEEVFGFIFAPGFSTAEKVTDLSGRGVGLDVVHRNIARLRGSVDISSTPGKGTTFRIILPLTLAIIDGLIVMVGEERYVIPTLSVRESFRPRRDMLAKVQGKAEIVNVRGRLIPLLRLHEVFGVKDAVQDPTEAIVIVVQSGTTQQCLLVDRLLHKQEVVIKNLNEILVRKNSALAGATILGDGRVGLILDVNSLAHRDPPAFSKAA